MKKIVALALSVICILSLFCSCAQTSAYPRYYQYSDLSQFITVGKYKGIKVDVKSDEIQSAINSRYLSDLKDLNMYNETEMPKGTAVQNGDTVKIDYVGKIDGVAFEGGTAKNQSLVIGSGSYIEGFESGLVGVKSGETVDLHLTFPEDYQSADLAGKAVIFTVTVKSVTHFEYQEMTDAFAVEVGYKDLNEYKDTIKQEEIETYIWTKQIVGNSKLIKYPQAELKKNQAFFESVYEQYKKYYSEKNYNSLIEKNAQNKTKEELVVCYIASKENLTVSDEEIEKQLKEIYVSGTYNEKQVKDLINNLMAQKVMKFVLDNADYISK
ncbi:MAG: FKBP-type peptidyl-prolyl cis-trans isomerase [Oscillospiraceae bacterium]|nr:FKBP-type peptidyl-prolyl cis-trans isomerase [Candidatus Equicaccousia limihippi]